ncbi:unnamed protein product (macronuclear) [Paramecium tetraurelia]|uniref:Palmitoyltransferase n=1 Tax=Paramecium tetraurelia TaxID=5888 RepID=A0CKN0_PARTE|nr:uncharacterized protein GSPATT00001061001 [Paramecium tetraurelia]CAK71347.1 unnamed protein product [Paramecium tetraurelia]|eukprot:XP_001438744.1 hypothetical protein (macronuclear) [Paramecium tetraurelia strain d4-2]
MNTEIELDKQNNISSPLINNKENQQKSGQIPIRSSSIYQINQDLLRSQINDQLDKSLSEFQSIEELRKVMPFVNYGKALNMLLKATQEGEVEEFLVILDDLKIRKEKLKLDELLDQKKQTLLHIACFKNQPAVVEKLLETAKQNSTQNQFEEWINRVNQDQFASVHFAAYVGSISILEMLKDAGADLNIKNSQGQNALSVAAQGDQVQAMVWLYLQGQSIVEQDSQGGTPLHWATYFDSLFALQFLLSWLSKLPNYSYYINLKDGEGMTPLHLAAVTGNCRIAKKLLQKGANKSIRDIKNQTPAEAAFENQQNGVFEILMSNNCLLEFLNIKPSIKPPSVSWTQIIAFFIIYFYCMIGTILFVYPFYFKHEWLQILSVFSFLLGIILYFLTMFLHPGFIEKSTDQQQLFKLLNDNEPWEVCQECLIKKPERSRHCEFCKRCIVVYDHHCPWVNNCIGAKNYFIYFSFISIIWINLIHILILNSAFIGQEYSDGNPIYSWFNNMIESQSNTLFITKIVVQSIIIFLSVLFIIAVSHLLYGQIITLFTNRTTFEKYKQAENLQSNNGKSKSQKQLSQQSIKAEDPKIQCSCANCILMCCGNANNPAFQ